jgi:O-acetyl-ADP-ribose deacetylase (regulator of RNase III)
MQLHLVDQESKLVEAWEEHFKDCPEVAVVQGDILAIAHNSIVSPANSFGLMDGGIDLTYIEFFGTQLQVVVLDAISHRSEGMLPVGASVVVKTGNPRIQYLIVAPTMMVPELVPASNCFFAMSAVLRAADNYPGITDVYCPGLATGIGCVPFDVAASEMANAYRKWKKWPK